MTADPHDPHHLAWGAESLYRQLEPLLPGLGIEIVARLESTSSALVERARALGGRRSADTQPVLLVAEQQTRGRGRQGRPWISSPGASLTFSLALALAPPAWAGLSLAVGVALADALDPSADDVAPRIGLKWPNDLWLWAGPGRGRKLGGVLVETVTVGARRMVVVGVGLNVRPQAVDPASLSQGYASLDELGLPLAAPQVLARVMPPLVRALRRFEADGFAPFAAAYARRDVLAGQPIATVGTLPEQVGVGAGVDADGALVLRADGGDERVVSGEVSVRLQAPGDAPAPEGG